MRHIAHSKVLVFKKNLVTMLQCFNQAFKPFLHASFQPKNVNVLLFKSFTNAIEEKHGNNYVQVKTGY